MKLNQILLPALLVLFLALGGCGSKSKKNSATDDMPLAATDQSQELELNADSDSGKAGPIQTVFFAFNSAVLSDTAQAVLNDNAEFLKSNAGVEVQVEGHCDERGGREFNIALGERRAQAVYDYLVSAGVDSKRLSTISFGKERPIAFGHDESSWSQNRRGNFVITAK